MSRYLEAFKKYAVFSGKSRRKEYWYFVLFNIIIGIVLGGSTLYWAPPVPYRT